MSTRTPASGMLSPSSRYRRLWRRILWHRRKFAAICAAVALVATLDVLRPPSPPSTTLLTARRDLPAGAILHAGDVAETRAPVALAPAHHLSSLSDALGRTLTSGIARGTPLTRLSIAGAAWADLPPGHAAVPVRVPDDAVVDLLQAGQHVRLASVDPRSPTEAATVVEDAVVLAIPAGQRASSGTQTGRIVVFDVPAAQSDLVTSSAVSRYLTVTWNR